MDQTCVKAREQGAKQENSSIPQPDSTTSVYKIGLALLPTRACNYKNKLASTHTQGKTKISLRGLIDKSRLNDDARHAIRVDVGGRTPILQVAITLSGDVTGDTDGSTTVSDARAKGADVTGLVATSETHVVVLSITSDVFVVLLGEFFNGGLNDLHTTLNTHGGGTEIGVASSTVPFTGQRLGVEGDLDVPLLGKADEEVTGHPEVVTHLNTLARANLELPLGRHDLGVDTADLDPSVQADAVVGLDQVTCIDLPGAGTAVVGALGTRETALRPTERGTVDVEQGVLLLKTEPGFVFLGKVHNLGGVVTVVSPVGSAVVVVALGEDEDVVTTTEGVLEDGSGPQVDIRVAAGSLVGGGTVEIPDTQLTNVGDFLVNGTSLGTETTVAIDPNIFGLDFLALVEGEVWGQEFWTVGVGH